MSPGVSKSSQYMCTIYILLQSFSKLADLLDLCTSDVEVDSVESTEKALTTTSRQLWQLKLVSFYKNITHVLPYSDKRKQLTNHPKLRKWCF